MQAKNPTYFIGYDAREHEAAAVCAFSIMARAKRACTVYFLEHRALRRLGLFDRPWTLDETGQFHDVRDGKPFSTEFSHSRFLVFHLAQELGITAPCAFLDCDFLFTEDPGVLMEEQAHQGARLGVMPRRVGAMAAIKMDGMEQAVYPKKLWSAFFTFNPSAALAKKFNPVTVNKASGRDLHAFLGIKDTQFWAFDPEWHVVPSMDGDVSGAKAIHYSEFNPWLNHDHAAETPHSFDLWHTERLKLLGVAGQTGKLLHVRSLEQDVLSARSQKAVDNTL